MASDVVSGAIEAHLTTYWTTTPLALENDGVDRAEPIAAYVAMEIMGSYYDQQSIGADPQEDNRWDEEGTLYLHVFVPSGTGGQTARGHAKTLVDLFRGTRLLSDQSLEFLSASIGTGERGDDNGNYWRVSVSIDWRRWDA